MNKDEKQTMQRGLWTLLAEVVSAIVTALINKIPWKGKK